MPKNRKPKKTFLKPLAILAALLLLEGCAPKVPDYVFMVQVSAGHGHGFHSLTSEEFEVDDAHPYQGKTWNDWVGSSFVLPPESIKAIKNYILLTCEVEHTCPQVKKIIKSLEVKLNTYLK